MLTKRAGISKEYRGGFILDEAKLRKLADVLSTYSQRLSPPATLIFEVHRKDDSFYSTPDIDTVLCDDNSVGKSIQQISVKLFREKPQQQDESDAEPVRGIARVCFGRDDDMPSFFPVPETWFAITEKDRDWCFLLADDLDAQIKRIVHKRSIWLPLRTLDFLVPITILVGLPVWVLRNTFASKPLFSPAELSKMSTDERVEKILTIVSQQNYVSTKLYSWVILFLLVITTLMILSVEYRPISRIWSKLYQPVFYWGDMMERYDRQEKLRANIKWVVVIGFIVSLVASFAYSWLRR